MNCSGNSGIPSGPDLAFCLGLTWRWPCLQAGPCSGWRRHTTAAVLQLASCFGHSALVVVAPRSHPSRPPRLRAPALTRATIAPAKVVVEHMTSPISRIKDSRRPRFNRILMLHCNYLVHAFGLKVRHSTLNPCHRLSMPSSGVMGCWELATTPRQHLYIFPPPSATETSTLPATP